MGNEKYFFDRVWAHFEAMDQALKNIQTIQKEPTTLPILNFVNVNFNKNLENKNVKKK